MGMYFIESIGFSASHSLTSVLEQNTGNYVVHGSRNCELRTPIGVKNQSIAQFLGSMHMLQQRYNNVIAIHAVYPPHQIKNACLTNKIPLIGLCRRNQKKQILSCFFWAINGFLSGRAQFSNHFAKIHKELQTQNEHAIQSNPVNNFLFFSINRVLEYNLLLTKVADYLICTEDFIQNPAKALSGCGLDTTLIEKNISAPHLHSHAGWVKQYEFLDGVENHLEDLLNQYQFKMDGKAFTFQAAEAYILNQLQKKAPQ